jgi:hypothetical protein
MGGITHVAAAHGLGGFPEAPRPLLMKKPFEEFRCHPLEDPRMTLNLNNFFLTAERAGLPVWMLRFVWERCNSKLGDKNETNHGGTIFLTEATVNGLRKAVLGWAWVPDGHGGYKKMPGQSESVNVGSLYHEAMHGYLIANMIGKDGKGVYADLLNKAKEHYKGARVRGKDGEYVADDTWGIGFEAACEYAAHRAAVMWGSVDMLHEAQQDIQRLSKTPAASAANVRHVALEYNRLMKNKTFGYEEDGDDDYHVVDKEMPRFLTDKCDAILEHKIPDNFMAAPNLAYLYNDVMRQLTSGPDSETSPRLWR